MIFKPSMYKKDIFSISYDKLKKMGKRVLIYDLDNTLALIDQKECPKKTKDLINKLKKDFDIYIISNNNYKRILPYMNELGINGISNAIKPSTRGLRKIIKEEGYKKSEMVMIGDQMVTDILSANRFDITSILVDPLGVKDLKITGLNRFIESIIIKKYTKKNVFKRGKYYDRG